MRRAFHWTVRTCRSRTSSSSCPGMAVTVEIKSGARPIISYLLSPLKVQAGSLRRGRRGGPWGHYVQLEADHGEERHYHCLPPDDVERNYVWNPRSRTKLYSSSCKGGIASKDAMRVDASRTQPDLTSYSARSIR